MLFLGDYLKKDYILANCKLEKKDKILKKIAEIAKKTSTLADVDQKTIYQGLKEREKAGSTAFSHNIAIPHCSLEGINDILMGAITVPTGAEFKALDGKKTKLFVFMISPTSQRNQHIRLLSETSRLLRLPNFVQNILNMDKAEDIYEYFMNKTRFDKTKETEEEEKFLFRVVIQDEDKFEEILEIFTSLQDSYISITELEEPSYYMRKMPLFASIWSPDTKTFNKSITVIVDKKWTNDTIRKINELIEESGKNPDIMLTVQKLFYFNGSLNL